MRRRQPPLTALLAAGLALSGCTAHRTLSERSHDAGAMTGLGHSIEGMASWYGPGFAGRKTANGEIYDPRDLTAAHRSLPFGTRVLVRNLDNDRTCWVRINDRGPFVDGRVIDLSYTAAQALGVVGPGTARVALDLAAQAPAPSSGRVHAATAVALPPAASEVSRAHQPGSEAGTNGTGARPWSVQVGAFAVPENADRLAQDLARRGIDARVHSDGTLARVRIGSWEHEVDAVAAAERLQRDGFEATPVTSPAP